MQVGDLETRLARFGIGLRRDGSMQARRLGIVQTNVGFERATQGNSLAFERNRCGHQFAAQRDEHRPALSICERLRRGIAADLSWGICLVVIVALHASACEPLSVPFIITYPNFTLRS